MRRLLGDIDLAAGDRALAEEGFVGEKLEAVFACVLEDDAHKVYRDGYDLADVLEIDGLALFEDDFVLVFDIYETDFEMGDAVAIGHFAEKYELVVADGEPGGVDGLNNVDDAGHSRYAVENDPVAYD